MRSNTITTMARVTKYSAMTKGWKVLTKNSKTLLNLALMLSALVAGKSAYAKSLTQKSGKLPPDSKALCY